MATGPGWSVEQQVLKVRAELRRREFPKAAGLDEACIVVVLARTGDWELAAVAIAMWPRPGWVQDLIGGSPHDRQLGEMLDPRDRAPVDGVDESWGHADTGQGTE